MKKLRILLILLIAACSVTHVYALRGSARGWSMGLKGGLSFPDMVFSDNAYSYLHHSTNYMPQGSLFFECNMAGGFAIRTEFAYVERGCFLKTDADALLPDYTYQLKQRYAEFRLGFLLYLFNSSNFQPYLFAMPYAGYRFDGTYQEGPKDGTPVINKNIKRERDMVMLPDFGVMGGLGFRGVINTRKNNDYFIAVEANYGFGLWNNFPTYSSKKTKADGTELDVGQPSPFASGNPNVDPVFGKRFNRGFEVSVSLAFPFSNFEGRPRKEDFDDYDYEEEEEEEENYEEEEEEEEEENYEEEEEEENYEEEEEEEEDERPHVDTTFLASTTTPAPTPAPAPKPTPTPAPKPAPTPAPKPTPQPVQEPSFKPEIEKINNITVRLTPQMANGDLTLRFSYTVTNPKLNFYAPGDDYAPGAYLYTSSKGCEAMLYFLQEKIQNDYAQFFDGEKNITVRIIGCADPTPIKNTLRYRGEFGEFKGAIKQGSNMQRIHLVANSPVKNNYELAYLRTMHVERFLKSIESLEESNEKVSFKKIAVIKRVNERDKRSVSIEIIIEGALLDEGW